MKTSNPSVRTFPKEWAYLLETAQQTKLAKDAVHAILTIAENIKIVRPPKFKYYSKEDVLFDIVRDILLDYEEKNQIITHYNIPYIKRRINEELNDYIIYEEVLNILNND